MSKGFKIARKPRRAIPEAPAKADRQVSGRTKRINQHPSGGIAALNDRSVRSAAARVSTRKTIEVPEDYFFRVKLRAVERHMLEKELWAEIVSEYFANHPVA
jgi:hypothetical protein